MRKIILIAMLLSVSCLAKADISITMFNSDYLYYPTSGSQLPSGALVQLVWDSNVDSAFSYATPFEGGIPTAGGQYADGDYVLFAGNTTETGGWSSPDFDGSVTYGNGVVGGANINSGYLYMYVFQNGAPVAGNYYARSGTVGPSLTMFPGSPTPTPNYLDITPGAPVTLNTFTVQAVPEPSTVGLLLIGAGLVAMRRFRRS